MHRPKDPRAAARLWLKQTIAKQLPRGLDLETREKHANRFAASFERSAREKNVPIEEAVKWCSEHAIAERPFEEFLTEYDQQRTANINDREKRSLT
jgi:hypothetical protein